MEKRVRRTINEGSDKEAEQKKPTKVTLFCRSLQRLKHLYCNINIQMPSITKKGILVLILTFFLLPFLRADAHADTYGSFAELKQNEEPSAFSISTREHDHSVLILVIHGGGIEPGTSELAREIAKNRSMYLFEGLKSAGNASLHLTSSHFDEPEAIQMVKEHTSVISLHGFGSDDKKIEIGGTDRKRAEQLADVLKLHGFPAVFLSPTDKYAGVSPNNLANQSVSGLSIQIEMSTGFRKSLFGTFTLKSRMSTQNATFYQFTETISDFINNNYK
ncbi:poly-gamma-glutamate hydrolase family protein [Bacillus nakamurai]|uniref:poly-gamma-glutamate hydrolase family protein n=1 Tax=Bacillus nakamurai TaxID=1793963 RepID=UPI001E58B506|nr:poly-gamma-glutamate hydrolase family protein [Bacillus nakamurai]MCC9024454.1 poly-gamma-glutamate hydrolase family protein [Bacillus nakamurai]